MISLNYKERYKRVLRKNNISTQDVKEFNEAVQAYISLYPDWKAKKHTLESERNLAS